MRQRVAIARAFAQEADILLMDEPFGALDAMTRDLLHAELERLWADRNLSVVFVTHNVREAARLGRPRRAPLEPARPGGRASSPSTSNDPGAWTHPRCRASPPRSPTSSARRCAAMPTSDARPAATPSSTQELAGLDALELAQSGRRPLPRRLWSAAWPKLAAIGIGLGDLGARRRERLASRVRAPAAREGVGRAARSRPRAATLWTAMRPPLRRAAVGFAMALVIGMVVGAAVSQVKVLRAAFGSFITGLQTMPSIAWFPLAVLLFKRTEAAMYFVVVLGAAPSIANGLIAGVDTLPPLLLRAGRTMGAAGLTLFRHVVLPGAMPSFVGGIKQGWAFAWRSLMAGELIVIIANSPVDRRAARERPPAQRLRRC